MLKYTLVFLLGCLSTYLYIEYPQYHFNTNISVNIIIAIATSIATVIHWDSIKKQRKDRVWDINKDILLDLAHELSIEIKQTEKYIDSELSGSEVEPVNCLLAEKIERAINVYRPLISESFFKELKEYKSINEQIHHAVFEEGLDNMEAYEESLEASKKLYKNILKIIEIASGIRN